MKYGLSSSYSVAIIFTVINLMKKMQSERNNLCLPIKHISVKTVGGANYLAQQIQVLLILNNWSRNKVPLISIIMVKMCTFVCLKLLDMWKSHVSPLLTVQSLYYTTGEYWEIRNRKSRYKPCRGRMAQGCKCCWSRTDNQIQKESGKGWKLHEHHTATFKCKCIKSIYNIGFTLPLTAT